MDFSPDHLTAKFRMADPFAFEPGQYATIAIEDGDRLIQKPYSIFSSPREPFLEFYIGLVPGGALTPRLWGLKVGDRVLIRKRMVGKLTLCEAFGDLHDVMLATVTGAAPFFSMLRTHAFDLKKGTAPARRFALFHGASRSADLGVYKDELTTLARDGWLDYVPTVSRPWEDTAWTGETGRVEDVLRKEVARLGLTAANAMGYLCGHPGMIENARRMLRRVRFPEERIRDEQFWRCRPTTTNTEASRRQTPNCDRGVTHDQDRDAVGAGTGHHRGARSSFTGRRPTVQRMYDAMRGYGLPRLAMERALFSTKAYPANEKVPIVLRWARALKHYCEKATVAIPYDELIVGRPNTSLGRWAVVYPELDGAIMPDGVKEFKKNKGKIGEVVVTHEDEKIVRDVLTPAWAGRNYATAFHDLLAEHIRFVIHGPDPKASTGRASSWTRCRAARAEPGAQLRQTDLPEVQVYSWSYFHLTDPDGHELSFARPL